MGMSRLDGFLPFYICMGLLCVRAPLSLIDNQITHVTKTTQQFGQNEFIAQCENCLTKYWTINKNATKKKKLIKNTLFKGGSGGKRLRLVSGSDKR